MYQNEMTIPAAPCFWPSFSSNLKFFALFKAGSLVTIEILMQDAMNLGTQK
jgi:hypothetical protein